jgi:hypothetical protein
MNVRQDMWHGMLILCLGETLAVYTCHPVHASYDADLSGKSETSDCPDGYRQDQ